MQDELKQNICSLIDDELSKSAALRLFEQIEADVNTRAQWERYNFISHVIKTGTGILPDAEFVGRVSRALEHEPVMLVPSWSKVGFRRKAASTALAASVAVISVIALHPWSSSTQEAFGPLAIAENRPVSANGDLRQQPGSGHADSRLNDYLVTHNETTYMVGTPGMLPYARVVSYNDKH
jgi:sigma-E factor negative regulatory protein RseA